MKVNGINYWALDIETESWDILVLYVFTDGVTIYKGHTQQEMAAHYNKIPSTDIIVAHNGGRYDFLCLLDSDETAQWDASIANGIIFLQAKGKAKLIDSYRLFVLSLQKWTGHKTKLEFPCICTKKCGGYCSISRKMSPKDMQTLSDYCINDCNILLHQYKADLEGLQKEGFSVFARDNTPRCTIGSVAYNSAKDWCGLPDGVIEPALYRLTKEAYYGGRTECFKASAKQLFRYDVNSMYPWALTLPVPVGQHHEVIGSKALDAFNAKLPGLYYIKTYQAPGRIACLPRRVGKEGRVLWATGYCEGLYPLPEAILANEECEQFEVVSAMVWEKEEAIYKPYIDKCFALRQAYKLTESKFEFVIKILLNSLYGKLAQGTEFNSLHKLDLVKHFPPNSSWNPIHGTDYWVETKQGIIAESAKPWQGAYITARARVLLYHAMKLDSDLAYVDTDARYGSKMEVNVGNDIGQFKFEGMAYDWVAIAPKVYRYIEYVKAKLEKDGTITPEYLKYICKAKGVPGLDLSTFEKYIIGETVTNRKGVNGVKSALARMGYAFVRRELKRTNNSSDLLLGSRLIVGDSSIPLHCDMETKRFSFLGSDVNAYELLPWLGK